MNLRPMLRAFDREDDDLRGEWLIVGLDEPALQELLGRNERLFESYPVRTEHVSALTDATGHDIDLARWDYFVELDAEAGA